MWGKLRRKISRTKTAVEQDSVKEVVLNKFEIVPSHSKNTSDLFYMARGNLSNDNGFPNQDGRQDCKCSSFLHFRKHFFGSFPSKRVTEDCGEISAESNGSQRKKEPDLEDMSESSLLAEEPNRLYTRATSHDGLDSDLKCDQPADEGRSCIGECRDVCKLEHFSTDTVDGRLTGESEILEDIPMPLPEDMKFSPPKLKRRERTKDVETYKSEENRCPSVVSERVVESVMLQREYSVLSSLCKIRSDCNVTKAVAENVCSSGNLGCHGSALDRNAESAPMYKCDDTEESMDSGHHPSDGDVDKGHSSPDLDLDECDGRESGYTTLDDVQPLPLKPVQLSSYAVSLDVDDGHCGQSDCLSDQLDLLTIRSAYDMFQQSDISTFVNEPTPQRFCCSARFQPVSDSTFSSEEVISSGQSNSDISASFPVTFGTVDGSNVRQWEHVDYVPADVSVSKIFEDSSNSGINDVYASVPRCYLAKLEESSTGEATASEDKQSIKKTVEVRPSNCSPKYDDLENKSVASLEAGIPAAPHNGSTDEWEVTDPDLSSATLDSDDGENVPPVPSRNYESCIGMVNVDLRLIESQHGEEANERIHMSWEEVMREARSLGIPLNRPQLDKSYLIPYSEQLVQSDSLIPDISEASTGQKTWQQADCLTEQSAGCSFNRTTKSKTEIKKGSPFKEKFRLPNPFSRKNKPERNESFSVGEASRKNKHLTGMAGKGKKSSIFRHHSSIDIQKRCLPRPPSEGSDASFIDQTDRGCTGEASSQSGNERMAISLHLPFSTEASPNRSWGSSSNILRAGSTACRSRRVFSDSSHWPNCSSGSLLPFSDRGDGTVVCPDPTSLISTNSNADFIQSFSKLKDCGWYWGPLGWENAEAKLENKPDGSFLVRDSSDDRYILSLSFRSQNVTHHTRIEHYKGMFSFYSQPKSHGASTIVDFIEKAMEHSRSGKFLYFLRPRAPGLPPAPVQLLFPISRLRNMHSLQHICRFVILKHVRRDLIDRLQIPPRLKEYLKETQYYIEFSDCDSMGHQYFSQEW